MGSRFSILTPGRLWRCGVVQLTKRLPVLPSFPFSRQQHLWAPNWPTHRRIATRYDKLARNYFSALCFVAAVAFWLMRKPNAKRQRRPLLSLNQRNLTES